MLKSLNQPVLINEGKVSCSIEQLEPLMGFELTPDRHSRITSQMCKPLRHAAPLISNKSSKD